MRLEDYTEDAICRSMGLESFLSDSTDPSISEEVLRLLFLPSFHPEVAITFVRSSEYSEANIIALRTRLWLETLPCRLAEDSHSVNLERESLDELFEALLSKSRKRDASHKEVQIDGMRISVAYRKGPETILFRDLACGLAGSNTVAALAVRLGWNAARHSTVKNALADVAKYLGEDYPSITIPPPAPTTRLLILGTPDDRKDYFEMLRAEKKRQTISLT